MSKYIAPLMQWGLTTALVVLKLTGSIDVSWWVVFAPVWVPVAIVAFAILSFVVIAGIVAARS